MFTYDLNYVTVGNVIVFVVDNKIIKMFHLQYLFIQPIHPI